MHYENTFKFALIASLIIHSVILISLPRITTRQLSKTLDKIEVTYYKLQLLSQAMQQPKMPPPDMRQAYKDSLSLLKKDRLPALPIAKEPGQFMRKVDIEQKKPLTIKQFAAQKKITLPPVKSEKMKNPVYNNYYQIVREKIRHRAYNNYARYETGEVYLAFVVTSDGTLKQVKYIPEKSHAAEYLTDVALRSIQDAAPFPAFPANLQFPELSFNVIISFEVNN